MGTTVYFNLYHIDSTQLSVMQYIQWWTKEKKTTAPLKQIIIAMEEKGIKKDAVIYCLKILLKEKYIKRSEQVTNKTSYVQLRTV